PLGDGVAALARDAAGATLLATGPLTDVAAALPLRAARVVVMGGAFGDPPGNVTPYAEFNWWADPHAADAVCRSGLAVDVVPLDVTQRVVFTRADAAVLAARGATFSADLLSARIALQEETL